MKPGPPAQARLAALQRLQLLDTPPEELFDRTTRLAARVFDVPVALVSLTDTDRQFFKSCHGTDLREAERSISFCPHVIEADDVLVVPDATRDPRFADNPLVTGDPGIRFYAGAPLKTAEGFHIGTVFENIPAMVLKVSRAGTIRAANRFGARLLGYAVDELIGRSVMELFHPADRSGAQEVMTQVLDQPDQVQTADLRKVRKNGEVLWARARMRAVRTARGEDAVLFACEDVTERKQGEQPLRAAKEEAEAASRAKSDFLSRVSHELRTPLNGILGFAQLMEMTELGDEDRDSVKQILTSGRHLLELVNELLDISRIEAGEIALSPEPVAVTELITEVVDLLRPLALTRGIRIAAASGGDARARDHGVHADRQRLRQILINLVSNAIKYNRPGGNVGIGCEVRPGRRLRLWVSDTGPGIAPEEQVRPFSPFERLNARATGVEGTGPGLALSRRMAEAMGGSMGVQSAPGRGSTFWLELPFATLGVPDDPDPDSTAEAGEARIVLHVDDNPASVRLVERIANHLPHARVISAACELMAPPAGFPW